GANDFARSCKRDLDEVHKTTTQHFDVASIRPAAKQRTVVSLQHGSVRARYLIAVRFATSHVKPPIRPNSESMKPAVVLVTDPCDKHLSRIGAPIAVCIFERHQIRRVGQVKLAIAPGQPHWE